MRGSNHNLRGGTFNFSCQVLGHIDNFSSSHVSGWICNREMPSVPVAFDIWVNGECVKKNVVPDAPRHDVEWSLFSGKAEIVGHLLGFNVALPPESKWTNKLDNLMLCLSGSEESIFQKNSFMAVNRFDLVEHIEKLFSQITTVSNDDVVTEESLALNRILTTQILPHLMLTLRQGSFDQPILVQSPIKNRIPTADDEIVDVIIPVYKGYQETLECIESVLATRHESPMDIIVINDRSPDARLSGALRKLATNENFTLIENEKNLGFVATVNKGMKLHAGRDVLLLNADTIVPKGWLNKLRQAAYAEPNIGTVTPFSNRATIFSLPRTCFDNDMPLEMSVEQMNTLCGELNAGVIVDVPTGVGFCMYIRRETLNDVGLLDEERWAKGYCEENDFCVRATNMGWRSIAACDVFVQHHGSVSFDTEKEPRVAENLVKLHAMYPDYPERIQRFLKSDPIAGPRGRVNMALLKQLAPEYILFVVHGLGGGTETAIRDLCKIYATDGKAVLILRSDIATGKLLLAPAIKPHEKTLITEYPHDTSAELLAEHLRELNIEYVYYHHTLGFNPDIWRLPALLGVPYDVMIHDFYLVCPRITLIDDSGVYCGQPDVAGCESCIKGMPLDHDAEERLEEVGGTVAQWRRFHGTQLQGARQVIAPSKNACTHIQKYLPAQSIDAIPHPEPAFTYNRRTWEGNLPHRVAILGAIGASKGSELLFECAKYALSRDLPLHFVIIGYTDRDAAFAELTNVEITGAYTPTNLPFFVEDSECTTALFLSVWPETFSYTLSEAWRLGLYPIAFDMGAQAERIREMQQGSLIPFSQKPKEIVESLINILNAQEADYESVLQTQFSPTEPYEF